MISNSMLVSLSLSKSFIFHPSKNPKKLRNRKRFHLINGTAFFTFTKLEVTHEAELTAITINKILLYFPPLMSDIWRPRMCLASILRSPLIQCV